MSKIKIGNFLKDDERVTISVKIDDNPDLDGSNKEEDIKHGTYKSPPELLKGVPKSYLNTMLLGDNKELYKDPKSGKETYVKLGDRLKQKLNDENPYAPPFIQEDVAGNPYYSLDQGSTSDIWSHNEFTKLLSDLEAEHMFNDIPVFTNATNTGKAISQHGFINLKGKEGPNVQAWKPLFEKDGLGEFDLNNSVIKQQILASVAGDEGSYDSLYSDSGLEKTDHGWDKIADLKLKKKAIKSDKGKIIRGRVSKVLQGFNRFNPSKQTPFLSKDDTIWDLDKKVIAGVPTGNLAFGKYQITQDVNGATIKDVSLQDLKKVGLSLLLRATGYSAGRDPSEEFDLNDLSAVQFGIKRLDPADLQATETFNAPRSADDGLETLKGGPPGGRNPYEGEEHLDPDLVMNDQGSYGQLNNHLQRFESSPFFMFVVAYLMMLIFRTSIKFVAGGLNLITMMGSGMGPFASKTFPARTSIEDDVRKKFPKGYYFDPSVGSDLGAMFGFQQTRHDYFACLEAGLGVFWGDFFSSGQDVPGGAGAAAKWGAGVGLGLLPTSQLLHSRGFYAIYSRELMRSFNEMRIATMPTQAPVLDSIEGALLWFKSFKESKFIKNMNILAIIGDSRLSAVDSGVVDIEFDASLWGQSIIGQIIGTKNVPGGIKSDLNKDIKHTGMNRIRKSTSALASSASPALYLLPDSMKNMSNNLALGVKPIQAVKAKMDALQVKYNSQLTNATAKQRMLAKNKIVMADVKRVENILEGEYMPFYFHDLRTNEIISFHAFLSSMSDRFNVSWNSVEAFGRADPIQIYKNTRREINVEFHVASFSPDDFDEMWWKINKLVSLVYPQYSRGRMVETADGKNNFEQPFSQIPSASPVVRLRLGELFKSNYSRFALARLFGSGQSGIKIDGASLETSSAIETELNTLFGDENTDGSIAQVKNYLRTGHSLFTIGEEFKKFLIPIKRVPRDALAKAGGKLATVSDQWNLYVQATYQSDDITSHGRGCKVKIDFTDDYNGSRQNYEYQVVHLPEVEATLKPVINPAPTFTAYKSDLVVDEERLESKAAAQASTFAGKLNDFMNPNNNPIVKSFENAGGRGLAGVIKSINFSWLENFPWRTDWPSRAPRMCKVAIDFAPIHDIAPGLDADGFQRAPVYPVGDHVKRFSPDPHFGENDGLADINKQDAEFTGG